MEGFVAALITGLVVVCISAVVIWCMLKQHNTEKQRWEQIAVDSFNRGKDEATETMRKTCDRVEEDKIKLSELADRELLIDTMLALAAHGRRLDRIDDKLKCITNYQAYIADMNERTLKLSSSFSVLDNHISNTATVLNDLQQTINETSINLHKLIVDLGSLKNLHFTMNNHVANLQHVERTLSLLQTNIVHVVDVMDEVMSTHDQDPMTKLKAIEDDIVEVLEKIETIRDDVAGLSTTAGSIYTAIDDSVETGIAQIAHQIGEIQSELHDVASDVEDLSEDVSNISDNTRKIREKTDEALDEYDYSSLYSKIGEVDDNVDTILDKVDRIYNNFGDKVDRIYNNFGDIDSLSSDISSIRSTVENSLTTYGYDNIPDKLDSIASDIDSIKDKVDA